MKRLNRIAAVLMLVLLLLGGYVGAYFAMSEYWQLEAVGIRVFQKEMVSTFFSPMVKLESIVRGVPIVPIWPSTQD